MSLDAIDHLERSSYLSFATLKKSGEYVATPVWFAPFDDGYCLFSAPDTGKIKRLRNFTQCRIAACNVRGSLSGQWLEGQAQILEHAAAQTKALTELRKKYGWQMHLLNFLARLASRYDKRAIIAVDLQ